ncbi:MAG: glycosyltransferase family 2 protein [Deltaproteobacteria bacterium]|nr:glycosyltransferase family 2 protein [Deltaproteobacteria bacterium]
MKISVVIPAFNEATRLPESLEKVCSFLATRYGNGNVDYEVVVVDDGSDDETALVAQRFEGRGVRVVALAENRGKGAALKAGVLSSRGETVLLCDADLSTPIEDLVRLEARLAEADLVVGSRAVADADIVFRQPFYREWMGKVFNRIVRLLGITGIKDTQCGFKLMQGEAGRTLFQQLTVDRFAFDVELIWLAQRHGYRVAEVGVTWANSAASKVDPVTDSFSMFLDVIRLRLRHRKTPPR